MSSVRYEKEKGVNVQVLLRCRFSFFFPFNSFFIMKSIIYLCFIFCSSSSGLSVKTNCGVMHHKLLLAMITIEKYQFLRMLPASILIEFSLLIRFFFFFLTYYLIDFCDCFMDLFKPKCSLFNFWGSIAILRL